MTGLLVVLAAAVLLGAGGFLYSRMISRRIGEDPSRLTPAVKLSDGTDYVPTPTGVVFAHHFASIAGAGPILGPVFAIIYGWLPALLWVVFGGIFIGAVHDYLATHMATREGGQSMATIARRLLGPRAFVAMMALLIIMLALVCAAFLNFSAAALTSTLPFSRIELPEDQTLFRVVGGEVVIGGIASTSVIVITIVAPLLGWLYIKKKVAVWKCSILAVIICAASIAIGLLMPVRFPDETHVGSLTITGEQMWMLVLSAYVLVAAGVPVWIFLQSRDFINVHILYVGMAALMLTIVVAGAQGGGTADPIPAVNIDQGSEAIGWFWPGMFIFIACGAVSGFHSLCAGGTTCKQLNSEKAVRRVGYYSMLLESLLAACVIGALMLGATKAGYLSDVHPKIMGLKTGGNPILGFAMAVGGAVKAAFGLPIAAGALAGMVLLEGFLVTTLDTAIRLTRYLIEEIWRTLFGRYDVFAAPVGEADQQWGTGEQTPTGADGIPITTSIAEAVPAPANLIATTGLKRWLLQLLRRYWFNSALAVVITLVFALTGGATALWGIFATSNQLLASLVLAMAALWLLRAGRSFWFALLPAVAMLVTTTTSLALMAVQYVRNISAGKKLAESYSQFAADIVLGLAAIYLVCAGVKKAAELIKAKKRAA